MDNIDFYKVGQKMKELRSVNGVSQQAIADDIGSTVAFVSNIENNRAKMNLRMVIYYSNLFEVPIDVIIDAGRRKRRYSVTDEIDRQILCRLKDFSFAEKKKLLQILDIIKSK